MDVPGIVVVDTSAAVEVLIADASAHGIYVALFEAIRVSGAALAYNELLEAELIEAAFTWDVRRMAARDWRRERRDMQLARPMAREATILDEWEAFVGDFGALRVPLHTVTRRACQLLSVTGLGSYDAVHAATAEHLGARLITHDRLLARAAERFFGSIIGRSEEQHGSDS
jgi:predicted nucleic acid-binding protein